MEMLFSLGLTDCPSNCKFLLKFTLSLSKTHNHTQKRISRLSLGTASHQPYCTDFSGFFFPYSPSPSSSFFKKLFNGV